MHKCIPTCLKYLRNVYSVNRIICGIFLCCSSSALRLALPAALLGVVLHGRLWGGAPPGPIAIAEAAAWGGAVVAGGTEIWKILEGFQG